MSSERIGIQALTDGVILSPFTRLRRLLEGVAPGHAKPIELTVGEPRETMPGFVVEKLAELQAEFAKYPQIRGEPEIRNAIADWIGRRYAIPGKLDPARDIHPINGSREGLFYAAVPAVGRKKGVAKPAILTPNPFFQTYAGAALACGAEPVYLPATRETGFFPDLDALARDEELLRRTAAFYLCSPANPQGSVASAEYIAKALALARSYDFMLFSDECYSEIYSVEPPTGALEVAARTSDGFRNLVVFNSLSKRSNLPGLRSGFVAGDGDFIEVLAEVRNVIGPQMPVPTQHVSAACWGEEQHVAVNRRGYRQKFDIADEVLKGRYGYARPGGGFFLWLDMGQYGGGVEATVTLWKGCGVKVLPGVYLSQDGKDGTNPGRDFVRVALVHDAATIREALQRVVSVLR